MDKSNFFKIDFHELSSEHVFWLLSAIFAWLNYTNWIRSAKRKSQWFRWFKKWTRLSRLLFMDTRLLLQSAQCLDKAQSPHQSGRDYIVYALRNEHCLCRSPIPPYLPEHRSRQWTSNFHDARYLSLCLNKFLKSVITLTLIIWIATLIFCVLMYGILVSCNGDYLIYAAFWIFDCLLRFVISSFLASANAFGIRTLDKPSTLATR